ncbi:MAG: acetolactate synthase large subunit, partial [Micropruina sp.]|uniref:acetolactate synthase large subunit n=1 Tax=Micropruina sp. TaxID=2737536 RepID=UPI0039E28C93
LRAGRAAILIRGAALHDGDALRWAGRIAAATGAALYSDTFAPRLRRGAGVVPVQRMPYRAADALAALAGVRTLILVGSQPPVAFFAYPGQPSELTPDGTDLLTLAHPHEDGPAALEAVARALGLTETSAAVVQPARHGPAQPESGVLDAVRIHQGLARLLPEDAIVSDEGVTASFTGYPQLADAAPHDVVQLTGGAIGDGLPVATGAAIAAPHRPVIVIEGDGSAMYTVQALWTQARERLDVTTIIVANNSYAVLADELDRVGATAGPSASAVLDLHDPVIDWVRLAGSMGVDATSVADGPAFDAALRDALAAPGPHLIEARTR